MSEKWVEKTANGFIKFTEPGQEVTGRLKTIDEIKVLDQAVKRASIITDKGNCSFLLTTQLEQVLKDIPPNTLVKVRFEGTRKTSRGANMKIFKVFTLTEDISYGSKDGDNTLPEKPDDF
jgi:hypothetical protein